MDMPRTKATRITWIARIGTLASVGLGAWVLVSALKSPESATPSPRVITIPTATIATTKGETRTAIDLTPTAARFGSFANSPRPIVIEPVTPPSVPTTPVADTTPPPQADELKYLGLIEFAGLKRAMIARGPHQVLVKVGQSIEGERVATIDRDFVELDRDGVTRRLERAERTGDFFTRVAAAGAQGQQRPGTNPNAMGGASTASPGIRVSAANSAASASAAATTANASRPGSMDAAANQDGRLSEEQVQQLLRELMGKSEVKEDAYASETSKVLQELIRQGQAKQVQEFIQYRQKLQSESPDRDGTELDVEALKYLGIDF
ncbi:MAG: hypothetical protein AB7Q00_04145 [Phycisphaerales bacterium]